MLAAGFEPDDQQTDSPATEAVRRSPEHLIADGPPVPGTPFPQVRQHSAHPPVPRGLLLVTLHHGVPFTSFQDGTSRREPSSRHWASETRVGDGAPSAFQSVSGALNGGMSMRSNAPLRAWNVTARHDLAQRNA